MLHDAQNTDQKCPCGSGKPFSFCCEQFITGRKIASTAEMLMRSRYSAFTVGAIDYLIDTTAPEHRSKMDVDLLGEQIKYTIWLDLKIIDTKAGLNDDQQGQVEFKAEFEADEQQGTLHEVSNFRKEGERWYYVDGQVDYNMQ